MSRAFMVYSNGEKPVYLGDFITNFPIYGNDLTFDYRVSEHHFQRLTIPVVKLSRHVDAHAHDLEPVFHLAPVDAEVYYDPTMDKQVATWKVLMPTWDQYEIMFDMDCFNPNDYEPGSLAYRQRMDASTAELTRKVVENERKTGRLASGGSIRGSSHASFYSSEPGEEMKPWPTLHSTGVSLGNPRPEHSKTIRWAAGKSPATERIEKAHEMVFSEPKVVEAVGGHVSRPLAVGKLEEAKSISPFETLMVKTKSFFTLD